ncbi:MAG TPA: phosphoglycerate kinase [Candidatus Paceibacterota bacterium]
MRSIKGLRNIKGKKVLVRVDFNVPVKDGKVEDDFRIKKALPTIEFLTTKGAKIILITHLGKGGDTLAPVAKSLNKFIKAEFTGEILGPKSTQAVANMQDGEVVLLENLRNDKGEKECSQFFAMNLAKLADIYVNEAFPVDHRQDASLVLLPKLIPAYAGLQLEKEVKNLSKVFDKPKHPFLFILGGAKFSTKLPLIEKYLKLADHVFIGGALLNDLLKAKGYEVGRSLLSDENFGIEKIIGNKKIIVPADVVVEDKSGKLLAKKIDEVEKNDYILDIGQESIQALEPYIQKSKLILWNGPLGKYEAGGGGATKEILKMVAGSKAESIIGGGDTVALISEMKMEDKFSFVSTGGGATLEFLDKGTLPAIQALG